MECYNCGCLLSENDYCTACGVDVGRYKKIMYAANRCYNDGLARANVRDLSGAILSLKECLKFNKAHVEARNLLGLIYFEMGESVQGLSQWVISKNIRKDKNLADTYINMIQMNQGRLETITTTIRKFNKALNLCEQDSPDLAIIQLKKVLSLNSKYIKAHLLLALLYINQCDYDKAGKEIDRVLSLDCGNLTALRYRKEIDVVASPEEEKSPKKKKNEKNTLVYKSGNETIIQPLNERETIGLTGFIQIAIGILIGVCATYFLVVPAKVKTAQDEMNVQISEYGEQIDKKNADIEALNTRITSLEQTKLDLQDSLSSYEGTNGALDAYNCLLEASYEYMNGDADTITIEQYLDLIGTDFMDSSASAEFIDVYNFLREKIGGSVSETYYDEGLTAYNQMNYAIAIADLAKAFEYDNTNDDALYYLALAYYDSGDVVSAKESFNQLISIFPESSLVDKAMQRLEEIGE